MRLLLLCSLLCSLAAAAATEIPQISPSDLKILARVDSLWDAGQGAASLPVIDSLLGSGDATASPRLRSNLLRRSGARQLTFGDAARAERDLREAASLNEAENDTASLCATLFWLGIAVDRRGAREEAREINERLLRLATIRGDLRHQGWAMAGLAQYALNTGRDSEALDSYCKAGEFLRAAGDREGEVRALIGEGRARSNLARYEEALACFRSAAETARKLNRPMVEAMALNNVGTLEYSLGDPSRALEVFESAYHLQREHGYLHASIPPAINMALCEVELGRFGKADSILGRCLEVCREQDYDDLRATVLVHMAEAASARRNRARASRLYEEALAGNAPLRVRLHAHIGLTVISVSEQGFEEALAQSDAALRLLDGRKQHDLYPQVLITRANLLLSTGRSAEAMELMIEGAEAAEPLRDDYWAIVGLTSAARICRELGRRAQALGLLNRATAVWMESRGAPLDPEWRERRGESSRMLYGELAALLLNTGGDASPEDLRQVFDRLQVFKARTLLERMMGPGEARPPTEEESSEEIVTLREIQESVLVEGELLLDAYLGPQCSFLFAVTRQDCRAVRLPPEPELGPMLTRYHELLSHPPAAAGRRAETEAVLSAGEAVSPILLGEVAEMIERSTRVLFSPDGALNLIPLTDLSTFNSGQESGTLGDREWTRVPSASVLKVMRDGHPSTPPSPKKIKLLAVANETGPAGRYFPGAVREVRMLKERFRGVEAHILSEAGSIGLAADLAEADLLHLAAHASVNDQNPWQSEIWLTQAESGAPLRASQIARLELPARLVVLSGCESAGGRILSGEGVLGLSSAFLSAGVPVVLATLWPIDDHATSLFMEQFYESLAAGRPATAAVEDARRYLRSRPETDHPFFWAGFVLIGDGRIEVQLERRGKDREMAFPAAIILTCIGLILGLRRSTQQSPAI